MKTEIDKMEKEKNEKEKENGEFIQFFTILFVKD